MKETTNAKKNKLDTFDLTWIATTTMTDRKINNKKNLLVTRLVVT